MSKNKQKTFLTGYGVVTGAAAIGLLYMAFTAKTTLEEKTEAAQKKADEIIALKKAPIYPKEDFASNIKGLATAVVSEAEKMHGSVVKFQVPWQEGLDGTAVQSKLIRYRDQIIADAKGRGVVLPAEFALGLERYVEKAPTKSASLQLNFIVESVNKALETILKTGITQIDSLSVIEADWEKAEEAPVDPKAPKKKPVVKPSTTAKPTGSKAVAAKAPALPEDSVFKRFRILMNFTGSEAAVQDALNSLATAGPEQPFFVVNSIRMENEKKVGPQKDGNFSALPLKDPNATNSPLTGEIDPEVTDVRFILGSEHVGARLDADLVLFGNPQVVATLVNGEK